MSGDYHSESHRGSGELERNRERKMEQKMGIIFVILKVFPRNIVEVASSKFQAL